MPSVGFDAEPSGFTRLVSSLLPTLIGNPDAYSPGTVTRQATVLRDATRPRREPILAARDAASDLSQRRHPHA